MGSGLGWGCTEKNECHATGRPYCGLEGEAGAEEVEFWHFLCTLFLVF